MSEAPVIYAPVIDQDPLRVCLDCLSEGFQIIGFDWSYVYLNPAAARHGRRDATQLIGKPISEMFPGIEQTPLFEVMRKCMAERTTHVLENEFTFPDGTRRWFELRVQPVPAGICVYSTDIDERKRREAQGASSQPDSMSLFRRIGRLFGGR